MKIHRVPLKTEDLARLADPERDFLLLAGHMLNEMNSLHKVFAWCIGGHEDHSPANPLEGTISTAQAMIYARLLAGKELEGWEVLGKAWFGTRISQRIEPRLHPDALEALRALKKYFNSANLIYKVRHSFAFHYSASGIGATWERASREPFFETVLGGNIGNNFFLAAETAANVALFSSVEPDNLEEGMRRFLEEVGVVSRQFITFLEGVNMAIVEELTGRTLWDLASEDEVFPSLPHSAIRVPHFCLPEPSSDPNAVQPN